MWFAVVVAWALLTDVAGPAGEPALDLALSSKTKVTVVRDAVEWFGPQSYSLVGHVRGDPASSVVLAIRDGVLWGHIVTGREEYRVRSDTSGAYQVECVAPEVSPGRAPIPVPPQGGRARGELVDDGTELDVLVVYTAKARRGAGGTRAIESLVQLGITEANLALSQSAVATRLRLVDLREIDYREAGDVEGDLELLRRATDGAADDVLRLRDAQGADFVQLVVEEGDGCGIAYVLGGDDPGFDAWAFSVVERACIDRSFGLAHELGHNLGCDHALEDPRTKGAFPFSHGYKDFAAGVRTIMAYGPGQRIPRFSNPEHEIRGVAIGGASSNNARSINLVRATLANFRASLPRPRMTLPEAGARLAGDTVRLEWTIAGEDVAEWWVVAGTRRGSRDLFDSGSLGRRRRFVRARGLASDGAPVFVRLWYRRDTVWLYEDFDYPTRPSGR